MTESAAPYAYEPLEKSRDEVRLLRISPTEKEDHAALYTCEITVFDLDSAPTYIALSYAWGGNSRLIPLHVAQNGLLSIGQNLHDFFCHFAANVYNKKHRPWIWVDQISIDQMNVVERNHQVQLMSRIYQQSCLVLMWLGSEARTIQAAQDFVSGQEDALKPLLENAYFSRLWIVQEVLLAPDLRVVCGPIWIQADIIRSACVRAAPGKLPAACNLFLDAARTDKWWRLKACIDRYSRNECSDPRDKVYGLLGLVQEHERPKVDYNKSVHEVFTDADEMLKTTFRHEWPPWPIDAVGSCIGIVLLNTREVNSDSPEYAKIDYLYTALTLARNMGLDDSDTSLTYASSYVNDHGPSQADATL